MKQPLTRQELDASVCGNLECLEAHGALYIHSRCHPSASKEVRYEDGILTVECGYCNAPITTIAVAEGDAVVRPGDKR